MSDELRAYSDYVTPQCIPFFSVESKEVSVSLRKVWSLISFGTHSNTLEYLDVLVVWMSSYVVYPRWTLTSEWRSNFWRLTRSQYEPDHLVSISACWCGLLWVEYVVGNNDAKLFSSVISQCGSPFIFIIFLPEMYYVFFSSRLKGTLPLNNVVLICVDDIPQFFVVNAFTPSLWIIRKIQDVEFRSSSKFLYIYNEEGVSLYWHFNKGTPLLTDRHYRSDHTAQCVVL